jgi:hypothetical protein
LGENAGVNAVLVHELGDLSLAIPVTSQTGFRWTDCHMMITERCGEKGLGTPMRDTELGEVVVFGWLRDGDRTAFTAQRRRGREDEKHENEPPEKHQFAVLTTAGAR